MLRGAQLDVKQTLFDLQTLIDGKSLMRQFLIKYYKFIFSKDFIIIVFILLCILLISFNLPRWLTVTGAVSIFVLLLKVTAQAGHFVQRITDNAIFTVCPRCGYANVTLVKICQNCDYRQGSSITPQTISKELSDDEKREIDQNRMNGIHKAIPLPVIKNLPLLENEIVLIAVKKPSMRLFSITRNGDHVVFNKFNGRCILNWVILTNRRVCFYAEMFGGWRLAFYHSYDDIKRVRTENKIIYSQLLDEVDRMTIETTDGTYQLRGLNPKKLYDAINANAGKYRSVV